MTTGFVKVIAGIYEGNVGEVMSVYPGVSKVQFKDGLTVPVRTNELKSIDAEEFENSVEDPNSAEDLYEEQN